MRNIRLFAVLGTLNCAVACGDIAGPEIAERYVLRSIDGDPLPAVFRDGDFATLSIIADTLFLAVDGTGYEVQLLESISKADGHSHAYSSVSDLEYTVTDGNISVAYECPDMASCIAPPHMVGAITITGIVFDVALGRVPLQFERLDND
jgi:hypothetical protein